MCSWVWAKKTQVAVTGRCSGRQPTVQQQQAHSTGQESWEAVKIIISNWKASPKNQQYNLRETQRKEQTRVKAEAQGAHCLPVPPHWEGVNHSQATSPSRRQRALSWFWMTQMFLQALWCFARSSLFVSCCLSYPRHWFPALNKEDVKSTEFDELPGIWLGCKDFDILQKLRIKISCCCCQVCVTVFIKKIIFQEQINPNKDISSCCTFVPRYRLLHWLIHLPYAFKFILLFIPTF